MCRKNLPWQFAGQAESKTGGNQVTLNQHYENVFKQFIVSIVGPLQFFTEEGKK